MMGWMGYGSQSRSKSKGLKPLLSTQSERSNPLGRSLFGAFFGLVLATSANSQDVVEMPPIGLCLDTNLLVSLLKSKSNLEPFAFGIAGLDKTAALSIFNNKHGFWVLIQSKKENGRSCVIGAGTGFTLFRHDEGRKA